MDMLLAAGVTAADRARSACACSASRGRWPCRPPAPSRAWPRWRRDRWACSSRCWSSLGVRRGRPATWRAPARRSLSPGRLIAASSPSPRPGTCAIWRAQGRDFVDVFLLEPQPRSASRRPSTAIPARSSTTCPCCSRASSCGRACRSPRSGRSRPRGDRRGPLRAAAGWRCRSSSSRPPAPSCPATSCPACLRSPSRSGRAADRLVATADAAPGAGRARRRPRSPCCWAPSSRRRPSCSARRGEPCVALWHARSAVWALLVGARRSRRRVGPRPGGRAADPARRRRGLLVLLIAAPRRPSSRGASRGASCSCPRAGARCWPGARGARRGWPATSTTTGACARSSRWRRSRRRPRRARRSCCADPRSARRLRAPAGATRDRARRGPARQRAVRVERARTRALGLGGLRAEASARPTEG